MAKKVEDSNKYLKDDKLSKIPSWLKILLLKYWVAGATLYFFGMGGSFLWQVSTDENINTYNLVILLAFGYALFMEYLQKPVIRLMRTNTDDTYYYNMINLRGAKSLFAHIFYSVLITFTAIPFSIFLSEHGLDRFFDPLDMTDGFEPLTLSLVYILFDFIFLFIKNSIIGIYKRVRYKQQLRRQQELLDENDVVVYGIDESINDNDNFLNESEEKEDSFAESDKEK